MAAGLENGEHIIGVDIGGTKIAVGVLNHKLEIVGRSKKRTRSRKKDEPTEERVFRAIRLALEDAKIDDFKAIGMGSPGPLDPKTGVIIDTPNLAWSNFPLVASVSKTFKAPTFLDNDVNLGTYGEYHFGEARNCPNVVGIFPGTGIGGAIILDGKLVHGFSGSAGEIGHMTIMLDGPFCGCGKRGCLESVASRIAIGEQVIALAARHDAPYILETCGTDLANVRSGVLAEAVKRGDSMVEAVIRRAAYYVGVAAANLINIISPEAIILGGGLVEAMETIYMEEVSRAINEHAMPFMRNNVRLAPAQLGDDAVIMGAAQMALDRLA